MKYFVHDGHVGHFGQTVVQGPLERDSGQQRRDGKSRRGSDFIIWNVEDKVSQYQYNKLWKREFLKNAGRVAVQIHDERNP